MGDNEDQLESIRRVCICRGIPKKDIIAAIKKGARSVGLVGRLTGSGSGSCHGRRCTGPIEELIKEDRESRQVNNS